VLSAKDYLKVARARRAGARHALKIAQEARRADLPLDLAYALVEQESAFKNIFGCDHGAGRAFCHQQVTRERVQTLLNSGVANGVGLTQLTYRPFVVEANRIGGAHRPRFQLRVGFKVLKNNIRGQGYRAGIRAYNGSGPAAERYADLLIARRQKWHDVLNP
jgi:hypothetical protein